MAHFRSDLGSPIEHGPGAPKTPGVCHSTPGKDLETAARSRRPKKPHWIFVENLGTVEKEVEPKQARHDDTPRPDELRLGEDLDATLTNEGASDADNTVCETGQG